MTSNGYIKLHRNILNWRWYHDSNTFRVFVHLLLTAAITDFEYGEVKIKRGEVLTNIEKISFDTKLSISQTRTAIKHLKATGEIAVKRLAKKSVISILKYNEYQPASQVNSQSNDNQNDNKNDGYKTDKIANVSQSVDNQIAIKSQSNRISSFKIKNIKKNKNVKKNKNNNACARTREEEPPEKPGEEKNTYRQIADMYNATCVSFPKITVLSDKRKQAIKARLNQYTVDQFGQMFKKAQASEFLKGANERNWQANFDWLLKDANFAKVLDGNYDDRPKTQNAPKSTSFNNFTQSHEIDYRDFEMQALKKRMERGKTNAEKENIQV